MIGLSKYLSEVPDARRAQGKRVPMDTFLTMVILGYMSGRYSLNSLARFMKNNEEFFVDKFGLAHGVPGYTQIRTILKSIDFIKLNEVFYRWASQFIDPLEEDWLSLDGKGLNSTVSDAHSSAQNFHAIVSVFSKLKGIVLSSRQYASKKESEIKTVKDVIEDIEQKGMVLSLDALHCQKKQRKLSWVQEMTM